MITTKPYFYDSFKCIADKCSDSCCIGWEIDIDEKSLERFCSEKGELGKKLAENISGNSFVLAQDERCPFLKQNGLCELICEKGDDYICEICREHPRYHEWLEGHHDVGLGLCCEEACRLLFCSSEPLRFISEGEEEALDEDISLLLSERENLFEALGNRTHPLSKRVKSCLDEDISLEDIVKLWDELEPFDQRWSNTAKYIKENFDALISLKDDFLCHIGERVYEYEHLCLYLIHRYFMKSLYEYFPESVLRGVAIYLGTQLLFDLCTFKKTGKFDFHDRIDTAKYISKQLEYSEENIDFIMNT